MEAPMITGLGFNNLINWQYVEEVEISESNVAIIYYTSGRTKSISNSIIVEALKDFIHIFPDLSETETRAALRVALTSNMNTDHTMGKPKRETGFVKRKSDFDL